MDKTFTNEALTAWVAGLIEAAENDECFNVDLFMPTENSPVSIVGGWKRGFNSNNSDIFCMSKTNPTSAMCIKICKNTGSYTYVDYEAREMPVDCNGEIDNTEIILEWYDDPEAVAEFFMHEWERLMAAAE